LELSDSLKIAIVDYFDGKLTPSQSEELHAWTQLSDENLQYFSHLERVWHATSGISQQEYDIVQGLKNTRNKISRRQVRALPGKEIRLQLSTLYKVAAAVIFLVGLTVTGLLLFKDTGGSKAAAMFVETSAPKGSRSFIILPDSTTVWLNADTKFRYPVDYGTNNRNVFLEGEAYFKVSKNKKLPFKVNTSDITVTALGTAFNVKAYNDEGTIETTLEEGSVRIEDMHKGSKSSKSVILKPKQIATFHKQAGNVAVTGQPSPAINKSAPKSPVAIPVKVSNVADTRLYTSWKDPRWIFKNEKLSLLVTKLERRYDVDIIFMDKSLENYSFTGTLLEESLEQVMAAIMYTAPVRYEISAKEVRLYEDRNTMNQYKGIMNP
jgi:ferric-dicitrate binding protein FerR (iron transport regulator)